MDDVLSARPVSLIPTTVPTDYKQPIHGGVEAQVPFHVDQDAHLPIPPDVSEYDAMLIDQIGGKALEMSSSETGEKHDIERVIERIAEPRTVKLTDVEFIGDSSSVVDKRESDLLNQVEEPPNTLEEIVADSLERVQPSFQGHDIQDTANIADVLDQSALRSEFALQAAIEQESMDKSIDFTEDGQMTGESEHL